MTAGNGCRPMAVVTGVSSGIGYELARQFVNHGYDVVVAAEDEGIEQAARTLAREGGPTVTPVRIDLAAEDGVEDLYAQMNATGRAVAAIAINAGRGAGGEIARQTDLRDELNIIDLNVRSTVHLTKRVLPDMVRRGTGKVLSPRRSHLPCPVRTRRCTTPRSPLCSRSPRRCATRRRTPA
jgi:uncharacterized protein